MNALKKKLASPEPSASAGSTEVAHCFLGKPSSTSSLPTDDGEGSASQDNMNSLQDVRPPLFLDREE